ncbi:DHH family phosphoesterase [Candidatus Babeliales bacterium]|nr:DHH family phosphoesterase [Candidatus Babeliales bacterium]
MDQKYNLSNIKSAWKMILEASKITLLTHYDPDGDGICACSALEHLLNKMNKNVEVIYPNEAKFPPIENSPKNLFVNQHKQIPDLIITLDTANIERLYYPKEFIAIPIVNIDHHYLSNTIKGKINIIVEKVSSACEIVYDLIKIWAPMEIDAQISESLLYGIMTDTLEFYSQATYPSTLKASAELMEYGANLHKIKEELITRKTPKIIKIWGSFLANLKTSKNNKAAWVVVNQEDLRELETTVSSLTGFNNFLSQIADIDIIAIIYQADNGMTKVSLRSKKSDVNIIAKKLGGGGHKNASGILSKKPINEVVKELIPIFESL